MDLYPTNPPDPLLALLREQARPRDVAPPIGADSKPAATAQRAVPGKGADVQRIVTVVIDPGHGGEDPVPSGAEVLTRKLSRSKSVTGCAR